MHSTYSLAAAAIESPLKNEKHFLKSFFISIINIYLAKMGWVLSHLKFRCCKFQNDQYFNQWTALNFPKGSPVKTIP